MINIFVENNTPCIYKIQDWEELRKTHRIIGDPLGSNFCIPSLPLRLLPEEALLLKRKGIAKLVCHKEILSGPSKEQQKLFDDFKVKLCNAQKEVYRDIRKKQIQGNKDKIVAGKRKRGDERSAEEIFEEELEKSCVINEDCMLWPIFCEHQSNPNDVLSEVSDDALLNQTTKTKLSVYEDLWNHGYYITTGNKFGGDFLIYLGDPILHHALYIVKCIEEPGKSFHPSELVMFGRLGTSVKKKTLLSSLARDGNVCYITLNWMES